MDEPVVPPPPQTDYPSLAADTASVLKETLPISKELAALMERGLHSTKLPAPMRTARAAEAFQQAFEIIGGVPRLAMWADANPDKFFQLYGRMIGNTIAPVLPESKKANVIEMPWVTARRLAYKESQQVAEDIKAKGQG